MLRRYVFGPTLATLALLAARPVSADAIQFTGNVERDFALSPGNGVVRVADFPRDGVASKDANAVSNPMDVAQASWMSQQGATSGWNIKDLRLAYDSHSDTLFVGVNFFGTAGDADGNGDPGGADPRTSAAGGIDLPNLGGRESISVGFDLRNRGVPDVVAGVPSDKSKAGPGIDGFTVASYNSNNAGLASSYGNTLTNHLGGLAFDPDAAHPHFEFTVANFSKMPGLDPTQGFGVKVFAGTPDDVVAGEDQIPLTHVDFPKVDTQVPEPATLLSWTILSGGAAWRLRNRRQGRRPA
jgi:hypothetical protein